MRLNFFRYILIGFAALSIAQLLMMLLSAGMLGQIADRVPPSVVSGLQPVVAGEGSLPASYGQIAAFARRGQAIVIMVGLAGFLISLATMVAAASFASRLMGRLKDATRQLADVVFDEDVAVTTSGSVDDLELEIQQMMCKIRDTQRLCLDASPLTRLPGNRAIEQVLNAKMARDERFALCYVDLDDFKAFNDTYGYARGSEVIKMTGEIVHQAKARHANPDDFVGHIGGDDFVLVVASEKAQVVCESIIAAFDGAIAGYYDQTDRERGYIACSDRYGVVRRFPIMTLSIAVVSDSRRQFVSPVEIAQVATEIKDYVKTLPGSNYLLDRRTSMRAGT